MANFADQLDGLDAAQRDHLCDDATYVPKTGAPAPGHRVILERPAEAQTLQSAEFVRSVPTIEVEVVKAPGLVKGDAFDVGAERWRLAEAPKRPGDGRWWRAAVEEVSQS